MANTTNLSLQQILKNDSKAYLGIFAVSFCLLLVVAIFAQAMTWQWRSWLPGSEAEESLIGGVKGAVYTFMSHLL